MVYCADYLCESFTWVVNLSKEDGIYETTSICVGKDTIINGMVYHLIDSYYPLRQSSDSILLYDRTSKDEVLLYDFSLQVGDSIELLADNFTGLPKRFAKVVKTDVISLLDGRKARRIEYENKYPRHVDIEFVGDASRGILGPLDNMFCESTLVGLYENNKVLYSTGVEPIEKESNIDFLYIDNSDTQNCRIKKLFQDASLQILLPDGRRFDALGREIK